MESTKLSSSTSLQPGAHGSFYSTLWEHRNIKDETQKYDTQKHRNTKHRNLKHRT